MSNDNEKAIEYAWNWFAYHAQQRMTAFNYFLVLTGILIVALTTCVENSWWRLAMIVSAYGIVISLAFWFLDIRNLELVNCGRKALRKLEPQISLQLTISEDDEARNCFDKSLDPLSQKLFQRVFGEQTIGEQKIQVKHYMARHTIWLRTIMFLAVVLFLLAFLYSGYQTLASLI